VTPWMWVLLAALTLLLVQLAFLVVNLRAWPSLDEPVPLPDRVSLLIPARDEGARLGPCLDACLAQTHVNLEIIVLDDQSTDDTWDVIASYATDPRLRGLRGDPAAPGDFGKSRACAQLAMAATGDWLCFIDADVRLAPVTVSAAVATARRRGADLLSGFGHVLNRSLTGHLVTTMMAFTIAAHLPLRRATQSSDPRFVAANGMFLLFAREAYQSIGGHLQAGQHIVEDMALARAIKGSGRRALLCNLTGYLSVAMYDRARDVWNGFAKNAFAGIGRSVPVLILVTTLYAWMYILPVVTVLALALVALAGHGSSPATWAQAAIATALGPGLKRLVDRRFGVARWVSLMMAASALLLIGILLYSAVRSWLRIGYTWKGRRYQ
jgi:glycosyltransferase involved in cell wall biosynthesis